MKDSEMELLLRSFDDEDFGATERRRLEDLLDRSAELKSEHARMRRLRTAVSGSAADAFESDFVDRVMAGVGRGADHRRAPDRQSISGTVEQVERIPRWMPLRKTFRMSARRSVWMAGGAAAAVVLLIAIGLLVRMQPQTMSVPYGETQMVVLRDGSVVELSGGSTLTYPRKWESGERRVRLEGEAYFDVTPQNLPFIVQTFNADVTVLGTQFNVRAWEDDPVPETAVTLASGRVAVTPRQDDQKDDRVDGEPMAAHRSDGERIASDRADGDQMAPDRSDGDRIEADRGDAMLPMSRFAPGSIVLEPGQTTSVIEDSTAAPRSISIDRVLAWRSGGLAFVDQPLGSVFNTIERRFDVDVEALDPAIRNRPLTYLNPHPDSAEEVISDICHTLDLRYRRTANGYEVLPEGSP